MVYYLQAKPSQAKPNNTYLQLLIVHKRLFWIFPEKAFFVEYRMNNCNPGGFKFVT